PPLAPAAAIPGPAAPGPRAAAPGPCSSRPWPLQQPPLEQPPLDPEQPPLVQPPQAPEAAAPGAAAPGLRAAAPGSRDAAPGPATPPLDPVQLLAERWPCSLDERLLFPPLLQRRPRESLTPQQLREWYASWGCGGSRRRCRPGAGQLGAPGSGQLQLQRRPRETLTSQQLHEWYAQSRGSLSTIRCPYVICTGDRTGQTCGTLSHTQSRCFARLSDAWHTDFGDEAELPDWVELLGQRVDIFALDYDAILTAMYALPTSADRTCYLCVPPVPSIEPAALGAGEAAALGASVSPALGAGEDAAPGAGESALFGAAPARALYTFTLDSGASRSFFRDSTTLTPLSRPVPVSLADPSGGPVLAHSSTVVPCPAVPSGSLSGLHLPSFSTNLVSGADLQDQWVDQFTPGGRCVCVCVRSASGPWSSRLRPRVPLTSQQLHDWYGRRQGRASGARGSAARGTSADVTGAGSGAGTEGARTGGTGATGAGGSELEGAAAEDTEPGDPGTRGAGSGGASAGGAGPGGAGDEGSVLLEVLGLLGPPSDSVLRQVLSLPSSTGLPLQPGSPLPGPSPYTEQTGGLTERREPASRPVSPVRSGRSGRRVPCSCQPAVPGTHLVVRRPSSPPQSVPLPSPLASSLPTVPEPESDRAHAAHPTVTCLLATEVTDPSFESTAASALVVELVDFAVACRLDYATSLVAESESVCPPSVEGECALGTDVLEDRQEDLECLAAAAPHLVSMLLAPEGEPDAPDIPTPRSYAEVIAGTYVDKVPPPGANIVNGMWIFRGVDFFRTFSPTPKMTTLRVLLHIAAQRDYELHSLVFMQGSLHEEIWLRRLPGFTGSFPPGTQWSLRRPVYGLRQAPREWHGTLRTTLAALGFAPSTADPSLFLRTDTSLPPFYILVYVDDLVFATADTEALALVKSELQKRQTCTDLGELHSYLGLQITRDRARRTITLTQSHMVQQVLQRFGFTWSSAQATPLATGHSFSAPPSDESVEPSGPYPELVGCLMYLMTCTRPDLAYPLGLLARYVAPGRHRKVHMDAAKRVLRYLCSTLGMGLVLGGQGDVVLIGHSDTSWVDDQATQRSSQGYTFSLGSGSVSWRSTRSSSVLGSSCEAEIYATPMAAQELRWLTYLLTDLGERPRSPPVLYVDNKAAIALCQEHRLEHRTKHITLHYFLARELQQRGQLRLAHVTTRANTADIFTKALPSGDHQPCFASLDWSCDPLLSPTLPMGEAIRVDVPRGMGCSRHSGPKSSQSLFWLWQPAALAGAAAPAATAKRGKDYRMDSPSPSWHRVAAPSHVVSIAIG
ncbi:unnamed protein product, partial [Closterium sp. NIES-53]